MSVLFALVATVLTSFLPILNKHLLRDARPRLVAWITNAASLPILALGILLFTPCSIHGQRGLPLSCTVQVPLVDGVFVLALLASVVLNWMATLLSTIALSKADASLVSPLLTFNPAFTLLVAWLTLGEVPGLRPSLGIVVVLLGAYVLESEETRANLLAPLRLLVRQPGTLLAMLASALWGITTVLEKLAIDHMRPQSGPVVALLGTFLKKPPRPLHALLLPIFLALCGENSSQWPQTCFGRGIFKGYTKFDRERLSREGFSCHM